MSKKPIEQQFRDSRRRWMRLLTEFLQLKERYALLHPMLFDERVAFHHHVHRKSRGFETLQRSLFLSCCLDIYKLSLDRSSKACISYCIDDLKNRKLCRAIKTQYISDELKTFEGSDDPTVEAITHSLVSDRTIKFGADFDKRLISVFNAWQLVEDGKAFGKCQSIRHKLVAHTDLAGDYFDPIDITKLEIGFAELKPAIDLMQDLIEQLGGIVHGSGFAWERLEQNITEAADDFWGVAGMTTNQIIWQSGIRHTTS